MTRPRRQFFVIVGAVCALALGGVSTAGAAIIQLGAPGSAYSAESYGFYVGKIVDGVPPSGEAEYIDHLISLEAGAGDTSFDDSDEIYNRVGSLLVGILPHPSTLVTRVETGSLSVDLSSFHLTGFVYLLGKYDAGRAGSLVFLVPVGADTYLLPATFNGHELSHYSVFASVPDGGATLTLLGAALIGLGVMRRRFGR
jgi:hypothetical protein